MNPEFQRNLWLEAGPKRLAWSAVALAAIYCATLVLADGRNVVQALGIAGAFVFVTTALIWAPRTAGRAVGEEVAQRTWDFQRLSALEPWSMAWGKLFGSTSLAWMAAASGLVLSCLAVANAEGGEAALQALIGGVAGAVLLQAGSMALALIGVRRARAEGRSAAFRFTFGGLIGLAIVASVIGRTAPTGGLRIGGPLSWLFGRGADSVWWGLPVGAWFVVASLAVFAAWALVAAWRLMRLELQMKNFPWAWPGFVLFAGIWAAGLSDAPGAAWAMAGGVFAACAYAAAFAEPGERVRIRQFGRLARQGRWDQAAYDLPAPIAPVLLAAVAVIGIALFGQAGQDAPSPGLALAALAFLVRDLGVIAYFRFGPRPGRGDFGAVVALFVAYFVGGVVAGPLFLPHPENPLLSAACGAAMAAVAWVLAWKRIRAPEKSEG